MVTHIFFVSLRSLLTSRRSTAIGRARFNVLILLKLLFVTLLPLLLQNRLLLLQRQPICILSPFVLCEMLGKRGQSGVPGFRCRGSRRA